MTTKTITLTFEIPEFIDKNKFKKELENFIKKKILEEKFYKLMEGVDVEKLEKNVRSLEENSNSEILIDTCVIRTFTGLYISFWSLDAFRHQYSI